MMKSEKYLTSEGRKVSRNMTRIKLKGAVVSGEFIGGGIKDLH